MTEEEFASWSLRILLPALILFLGYIVWDLSKQSKAGRLGTLVLFGVLGLGVLGFMLKEVLVWLLGP